MEKEGKTMIKLFQIKDQEAIYPNCSFTYGMGLSNSFDPKKVLNMYEHVADIDCGDELETAFTIGNIGPQDLITRHNKMHSVSVGDILVTDDANTYIVAPSGFDKIDTDFGYGENV